MKALTSPFFLLKGLLVFTIAILKFVGHSQQFSAFTNGLTENDLSKINKNKIDGMKNNLLVHDSVLPILTFGFLALR